MRDEPWFTADFELGVPYYVTVSKTARVGVTNPGIYIPEYLINVHGGRYINWVGKHGTFLMSSTYSTILLSRFVVDEKMLFLALLNGTEDEYYNELYDDGFYE